MTHATTKARDLSDADDGPSRFLIGIDLGTTNSAVAYVDTAQAEWAVQDFPIVQLVGPREVEARETLPSFHYEAAHGEFPAGALRLPWSEGDPQHAVGFFARDHGSAVPGRLVVSAKSWLSHSGVDRTAGLLPWHGAADVERLSPVQVSSRYLAHIRSAWDYQFPEHPMSRQDVVLTVPASFDEVARELTVQAARAAGLVKIVLVEEPQAAFYHWIHAQGPAWDGRVKAGQLILVCDVGGGTSDFTLIRVRPAAAGKVLFHRVAVGEHLILGGDNLDLALAYDIEKRLASSGKLPPRQWGPLVRACRQLKETLLGPKPPEHFTVTLAGGGADADEREIAGASAHVADQDLLPGFHAAFPGRPLGVDPVVEGSLRLFNQHDLDKTGGPGRLNGQLARYFVERSRHCQDHVLPRHGMLGELVVPRAPDVGEIPAADLDRGKPLHVHCSMPGQKPRGAVDAGMAQP